MPCSSSEGMLKTVEVSLLLSLMLALVDYSLTRKTIPYGWVTDFLSSEVRSALLGSAVALQVNRPTDAEQWFNFLKLYILHFGTTLSESLSKVALPISFGDGDSLTLPVVLRQVGERLEKIKRIIQCSTQDSVGRADARRLIASAMAKSVPKEVSIRFYFLLGITASEEPPASLSFDDFADKMYEAVRQIWKETAETATQRTTFQPKTSPATVATPKPATPTTPSTPESKYKGKITGAAQRVALKTAGSAATGGGASPVAASPSAGAGSAGASKSDSKPKKCFNCDSSDHPTSQCSKPCKNFKDFDAKSCRYGTKCLLGPSVRGVHGPQ